MLAPWFCRLLLAGLVALLVLLPVAPALATAPVIQTFRNQGTDPHLVDCGTFFINGLYEERVSVTTFSDQAGDPVRLKIHVVFNGRLTNETTGLTVHDAPRLTAFVDLQTGSETTVGLPVHWTVPGGGRIVLDAGKIVFDPTTGELVFEAGPHPLLQLTGEETVRLLCSALAG